MHADRTNRSILTVFALLLIAAGAAGGCASFGVFGASTQHDGLIRNTVGTFVGRNGDWLWPVVAVVAVVVVVLCLRWLAAILISTDRADDLEIPAGGGTGVSTLTPAALSGAVTTEIESYKGVESARARVIGDPADPELVVTTALSRSADLPALRRRIETGAIAHARQAVGRDDLVVRLDLTVSGRSTARVD